MTLLVEELVYVCDALVSASYEGSNNAAVGLVLNDCMGNR